MHILAIRNPSSGLEHIVKVGKVYCFCRSTKVRGMSHYMTMNEGHIVRDWDGDVERAAKLCLKKYRIAERREAAS